MWAGLGRLTGSADLLAARWDGGLPGSLAAGRRPCWGLNTAAGRQQSWGDRLDSLLDPEQRTDRGLRASLSKTLRAPLMLSHVSCLSAGCLRPAGT